MIILYNFTITVNPLCNLPYLPLVNLCHFLRGNRRHIHPLNLQFSHQYTPVINLLFSLLLSPQSSHQYNLLVSHRHFHQCSLRKVPLFSLLCNQSNNLRLNHLVCQQCSRHLSQPDNPPINPRNSLLPNPLNNQHRRPHVNPWVSHRSSLLVVHQLNPL